MTKKTMGVHLTNLSPNTLEIFNSCQAHKKDYDKKIRINWHEKSMALGILLNKLVFKTPKKYGV